MVNFAKLSKYLQAKLSIAMVSLKTYLGIQFYGITDDVEHNSIRFDKWSVIII